MGSIGKQSFIDVNMQEHKAEIDALKNRGRSGSGASASEDEARRRASRALTKSKGRASTIKTGAYGLTGDTPVAKKALLGE